MPSAKSAAILVLSCEHGGNRIPRSYQGLFAAHRTLLATHRGWDAGALTAARRLRGALGATLVAATVSRLLIDLNRSRQHRHLFSEITRPLAHAVQRQIVARYYTPHRQAVEAAVGRAPGPVVHLGVHSFTPMLRGHVRQTDVALLYDPSRARERAFCRRFRGHWQRLCPHLRLRFNYPYKGTADGLTTALRRRFANSRYAGVELEINQKFVQRGGAIWQKLQKTLVQCVQESL